VLGAAEDVVHAKRRVRAHTRALREATVLRQQPQQPRSWTAHTSIFDALSATALWFMRADGPLPKGSTCAKN
jgi:hypothetical protein